MKYYPTVKRDGKVSKGLIPKLIALTTPWFYAHLVLRQVAGVSGGNPSPSRVLCSLLTLPAALLAPETSYFFPVPPSSP